MDLNQQFEMIAKHQIYLQKEAKLMELAAPLLAVLKKIENVPGNKERDQFFGFTPNVFPQSVEGENKMVVYAGLFDKETQYPVTMSGTKERLHSDPFAKIVYFTIDADGSASISWHDQGERVPNSFDINYPNKEVATVMDMIPHVTAWVEKFMPEDVSTLCPKLSPGGGLHIII